MSKLIISIGIGLIATTLGLAAIIGIEKLIRTITVKETDKLERVKEIIKTASKIDIIMFFVVIFVLVTTLFMFKNIITSLLAVIVVILIPYLIIDEIRRNNKREILFQLATAVRVFTKQFEVTKSYRTALLTSAKSTTGNASKIIRDAYFRLSHGEDLQKVMDRMGNKLGGYHGKLFSNYIVLAHKKGMQTIPLLNSLIGSIVLEQEEERHRQSTTRADNTLNLILIIVPVIEYFVLVKYIPEVEKLIFNTPSGSLLVTLWLVNIITWFITNKILAE